LIHGIHAKQQDPDRTREARRKSKMGRKATTTKVEVELKPGGRVRWPRERDVSGAFLGIEGHVIHK
jgi:hypothetical protein